MTQVLGPAVSADIPADVLEEVTTALSKTKILLMKNRSIVFFTSICLSLKHKFDRSVETAATDGTTIYYNPEFFLNLDVDERLFLLLHETLHVAFLHVLRLQDRDPQIWNVAADYVINVLLVTLGFKMPKMGLYDIGYKGMSTEEVYRTQPKPPPGFKMDIKPPPADANDPGGKKLKEELDGILIRAKIQAETVEASIGNIPGEIQIYIDKLIQPKLPWHQILARFITKLNKTGHTFRKPNRRFFPNYILPTRWSQALDDIAIFCDTSGSIDQNQFDHFLGESGGIIKRLKPSLLRFGQFDSSIKRIDDVRSLMDFRKIKFTGKGGTNIQPVLDWANENKPKLLVIFTDGYFHEYTLDPGVPVLWIIHSNKKFTYPFGRVIEYDFDNAA